MLASTGSVAMGGNCRRWHTRGLCFGRLLKTAFPALLFAVALGSSLPTADASPSCHVALTWYGLFVNLMDAPPCTRLTCGKPPRGAPPQGAAHDFGITATAAACCELCKMYKPELPVEHGGDNGTCNAYSW